MNISAQENPAATFDPLRSSATRGELEELLGTLERTLESPVYGPELKQLAMEQAGVVRQRLEQGDLDVGDRVLLYIETNQTKLDTLVVTPNRSVEIEALGTLSLRGVLRAELQPLLSAYITRFIRDPVVRASSLFRLSIVGAVAQPGFFTVPSDMLITDALMQAGGPAPGAKIEDLYVERAGNTVIPADEIADAIVVGKTLDQLGLRDGDEINIPGQGFDNRRETPLERPLRTFTTLLSIPATLFALTRLF